MWPDRCSNIDGRMAGRVWRVLAKLETDLNKFLIGLSLFLTEFVVSRLKNFQFFFSFLAVFQCNFNCQTVSVFKYKNSGWIFTLGQSYLSEIITQHNFDVDVNVGVHNFSSVRNPCVVDQYIDSPVNFQHFLYLQWKCVQVCYIQGKNNGRMRRHCLREQQLVEN